MSAVSPTNNIYFFSVPFSSDYKAVVDFPSATAQTDKFLELAKSGVKYDGKINYIRKDSIIKVKGNFDKFQFYNYCMYRNKDYGTKWFYAFITKIEYIAEDVTAIHIKTDVFQTWQFNVTYNKSYIERSHISKESDNSKNWLAKEPVGVENYNYFKHELTDDFFDTAVVILVKDCPTKRNKNYNNLIINNRTSVGGYIYAIEMEWLKEFICDYVYGSQFSDTAIRDVNSIISINLIPKGCVKKLCNPADYKASDEDVKNGDLFPFYPVSYYPENESYSQYDIDMEQNTTTLGNGYTPKNKKLFSYPYNFIQYFDYGGNSKEYKYEMFGTTTIFRCVGCVSTDGEFLIKPVGYGKHSEVLNSFTVKSYPQISIGSTSWYNYKAQMMGCGLISSSINTVVSSAKSPTVIGSATNAITGGIGVAQGINQYEHEKQYSGAIIGNSESPIVSAYGYNTPTFYDVCANIDDCKRIDEFFETYGYAINLWGQVDSWFKSRSEWNYIKTGALNIRLKGNQNDTSEFKSIFENGTTVWHNMDNIGRYDLENI